MTNKTLTLISVFVLVNFARVDCMCQWHVQFFGGQQQNNIDSEFKSLNIINNSNINYEKTIAFIKKLTINFAKAKVSLAEAMNNWIDPLYGNIPSGGIDFTRRNDVVDFGFGRDIVFNGKNVIPCPASIPQCESKISIQFKAYRDIIAQYFKPEDGFTVSEHKDVQIPGAAGSTKQIVFYPVYISSKLDNNKFMALHGSGPDHDGNAPVTLPGYAFTSDKVLQNFLSTMSLAYFDNVLLKNTCDACNVEPSTDTVYTLTSGIKSSKKRNMIFGVGIGFDKVFIKEGKKYGPYVGAELFAEINPTNCKILPEKSELIRRNLTYRSQSLGINMLFGIAARDSWMVYGICGPKLSFKNIKASYDSDKDIAKLFDFDLTNKTLKKRQIEFDYGIGTTYVISPKISVSLKFIRTSKSSIKIKSFDKSLSKVTSKPSKIILGLSYTIG